jgi:hypothetical protein
MTIGRPIDEEINPPPLVEIIGCHAESGAAQGFYFGNAAYSTIDNCFAISGEWTNELKVAYVKWRQSLDPAHRARFSPAPWVDEPASKFFR